MDNIKPGDKVLIALDVLDITTEDGPPNEDGVYLAKGAFKLGFADDPTTDLYITAGREYLLPLSSVVGQLAQLWATEPGLAEAVTWVSDWLGVNTNLASTPTTASYMEMLDKLAAALNGGTDGND